MDHPPDIRLFHADGILDAEGVCQAPGSLLIEDSGGLLRVLASGSPGEVMQHPAAEHAQVTEHPGATLIPGLVNAHTHLDLTHVGPRPYDPVRGRFGDWLAMVLRERATTDEAIRDSVREGIERSLAGGVVAVGDIAGVWSTVPTMTLRESPMAGVSFIECFGVGEKQDDSADRLNVIVEGLAPDERGVQAGISPHAPYTVGLRLYERVFELARINGLPLATHLAESDPEREFIEAGTGLFHDLLESMGLWDESIREEVGSGMTPIGHLFGGLGACIAKASDSAPVLLVHCNDVSDADLDLLAGACASVAYCPRGSAYFGAELRFGPHRYAEMLDRGINVALGTDSIINLPRDPSGEAPPISTLDEIRFLHARDGAVAPRTLLKMATINGARALGMDPDRFTFRTGPLEGVVAVEVGGFKDADQMASAVAESTANPALLTHPAPTP